MLVARKLTMIAGHEGDGLLSLARLLKLCHDLPKVIVKVGNRCVVSSPQVLLLS